MAVPCVLCVTRSSERPYRVAGLDACEACFSGDLAPADEAWGLTREARHWTEWRKAGDDSILVQVSDISLTLSVAAPFEVRFTRQWTPARWLRWLIGGPRDPEVGDPLFDDFVHVGTTRPEVVEFLRDEGLQAAIMSVVGAELGGSCEIAGRSVHVQTANDDGAMALSELEALTTAIAVQVERFARGIASDPSSGIPA